MQRDPIDPLTDALFILGAFASMLLVLLPDRPAPKPVRVRCCCGGPLGPTGNPALDEAWAKSRGE